MANRHRLLCVLLIACGGDSGGDDSDTTPAEVGDTAIVETEVTDTGVDRDTLIRPEADTPADAGPLDAPVGVWTWFDQPGSSCGDGSETGFGVNRGTSDDVLFVFGGREACWDFDTCFLGAVEPGPFGATELESSTTVALGILDRDDAENPYRTWSQVVVPYCTGDLHAGERVIDYIGGGLTRSWSHQGAVNTRLMLPRIAATFAEPERLVVVGASAGGYGATFEYATVREALAATSSALIVDSAPLLVQDAMAATLRVAWFGNWRLDRLVDPLCGQACKDDLSLLYGGLAERFPGDRMALLSSASDSVTAALFDRSREQIEGDIEALVRILAEAGPFRTFVVAGDAHGLLADPAAHTAGGEELWTWLTRMADGDPAWESVGSD